ncbi:hypothetical protein [Moorena producens]|nr:hypothetical protein [Moorena producens]
MGLSKRSRSVFVGESQLHLNLHVTSPEIFCVIVGGYPDNYIDT